MKIKKFKNFLIKENVDEYVSNMMLDLHSVIKNFLKNEYYIDFIDKYEVSFFIKIEKMSKNTISIYNSNISIKEILKKEFQNFIIEFYIEDDNVDDKKIFQILSHEISHVYQLISGDDKYFESFNKMINIENFKNRVIEYKRDFLNYIYYNFQHELDARINQTYEGYLYSDLKTLEDMISRFNTDKLYNMLIFLGNFDHTALISSYDENVLIELTNQFNILYGIEEIEKNDLNKYYLSWEKIFKENSKKYIELSYDAIKQAFNKINRYKETKSYEYEDNILNENKKYNPDDEILKLVDKFKKEYYKK